ncbi:hypothetical protein BT69DRAFT_1356784 [Atractiella rhizophila]|nr:hypothetical protein BT69DRAFT_1356784 [Atractiella rhizophila]
MEEGGTGQRDTTPIPTFVTTAPPATPSNKRKADESGFTSNKRIRIFQRVARYLQFDSRVQAEPPPILVPGLRPKVLNGSYTQLSEELKRFREEDWEDEQTLEDFMKRMYEEVLPNSVLRYHVVDESLQLWGNVTQKDSLNMDGMVTSCKFEAKPAYSSAACGVEVKTGRKSQAAKGKRQLGRGAVYPLAARPRLFFWGLLLEGPLNNKKYCWIINARGGRWQSQMQNLKKNFKEFLEDLETLVKGDEKETGFLDIFDHDGTLIFNWDLPAESSQVSPTESSSEESPSQTSEESPSQTSEESPSQTSEESPSQASEESPSQASEESLSIAGSTMSPSASLTNLPPSAQLGFKLDLKGRLSGCQVTGTGFRSNVVAEGLFQKYSITGSGTQVWACRFLDGKGYGVIKHVWLDKTLLGRMKKTVKRFEEWRRKLEEGSLDRQGQYWDWLEHAPRVLLSFPQFSTSKIFEEYAFWDKKKQPQIQMKELVPVLILHSTIGLPLGAATNLEEVLDTFIGVLRQLATLNDHNFAHRDVSYANIFMREWTPGQKETGTTLGWLNDFDFSIEMPKSGDTGSGKGTQDGNKKHHVEISGTFIFLSRRALQAIRDIMYNTGNDEVGDDDTIMDDVNNDNDGKDTVIDNVSVTNEEDDIMGEDDVVEESGESSGMKCPPPPPKSVRPLHRQTIIDDVESVLFCIFYFFCHFVPQKTGQIGPFRKRILQTTMETSMAQGSGRIYDNKEPSFIFGVEPLRLKGSYPLADWEGNPQTALVNKRNLLSSELPQRDFNTDVSVLLGSYDVEWRWDRKKVLSLLWEVSQPLRLNVTEGRHREAGAPKADVSKILKSMIDALQKRKKSFGKP